MIGTNRISTRLELVITTYTRAHTYTQATLDLYIHILGSTSTWTTLTCPPWTQERRRNKNCDVCKIVKKPQTVGAKSQSPFAFELQYHRRAINSNPNLYFPPFPLLSHQPFAVRRQAHITPTATVNRKHRFPLLTPKVKRGEAWKKLLHYRKGVNLLSYCISITHWQIQFSYCIYLCMH